MMEKSMNKRDFETARGWQSKMDDLTLAVADAQRAAQEHLATCGHWITENQPDPPRGGFDVVCVFCKKALER